MNEGGGLILQQVLSLQSVQSINCKEHRTKVKQAKPKAKKLSDHLIEPSNTEGEQSLQPRRPAKSQEAHTIYLKVLTRSDVILVMESHQ